MKEYKVVMIHKIRSVQFVEAENIEEAKEKAFNQSWEEEENWEEQDTIYEEIEEGNEIE